MNIADQQVHHGRTMYIMALEHSIIMFELAGEEALKTLKKRLADEKLELSELEKSND